MAWLNLIIDLAALALWLNWWQVPLGSPVRMAPITLAGTLKGVEVNVTKRWKFGTALGVLLLARGWMYLQLGAVANLSPKLRLGFVNIPFRADLPLHMLVFSVLSFVFVLATFYLWMLLLSAINVGTAETDPVQKTVRLQVRWAADWPDSLKFLCPFLIGAIAWLALYPLLKWLAVVPGDKSVAQLFAQAAVNGIGAYLAWKYLILGVFVIYLVNSHLFLGNLPLWNYVDITARNLLAPFRRLPLRAGKVDFAPFLGMALVILAARFIEHPPEEFYRLLPF